MMADETTRRLAQAVVLLTQALIRMSESTIEEGIIPAPKMVSIGDIVHMRESGFHECRPAIVTAVLGPDNVHLTMFPYEVTRATGIKFGNMHRHLDNGWHAREDCPTPKREGVC